MRPGIWQEFDGYEAIASEIEASRKINPRYVAEREAIAQYIDRLHPKELRLRVGDIIPETESTRTFRLVAADGRCDPARTRGGVPASTAGTGAAPFR